MPTNLHIEDELLEQARRLGRHRTKRETVNEALREYIRHRKRLAAARAFGTFDFDAGFDHKRLRRSR